MCSSCKMDAKDVEIMYQRQGAIPIEDFDEEIPYRHPPRKQKKAKGPRVRGCSGNNDGAHVYVWTTEYNINDLFFRFYGFHKYEKNICVGCGRYSGRQLTQRYEKIKERRYRKLTAGAEFNVKRGEPVPKRWRYRGNGLPSFWGYDWERYDEAYESYRKEYIKQNGYNDYVHGNAYSWWI